jgi:hypothetical protein
MAVSGKNIGKVAASAWSSRPRRFTLAFGAKDKPTQDRPTTSGSLLLTNRLGDDLGEQRESHAPNHHGA